MEYYCQCGALIFPSMNPSGLCDECEEEVMALNLLGDYYENSPEWPEDEDWREA